MSKLHTQFTDTNKVLRTTIDGQKVINIGIRIVNKPSRSSTASTWLPVHSKATVGADRDLTNNFLETYWQSRKSIGKRSKLFNSY